MIEQNRQYYAHPQSIVESERIGSGTRIWAFSHVMAGAQVGHECNIGEQCFIESGAIVGNSVVIKNGVSVWNRVEIGDHVFVGPNVVFTNDVMPRAKVFRRVIPTRVWEGASIGANSTIICGVVLGRWSMIGAGSVVTRSVPDFALMVGSPARLKGYVCKCGEKLRFRERDYFECGCGQRYSLRNGAVSEVALEVLEASRGSFTANQGFSSATANRGFSSAT